MNSSRFGFSALSPQLRESSRLYLSPFSLSRAWKLSQYCNLGQSWGSLYSLSHCLMSRALKPLFYIFCLLLVFGSFFQEDKFGLFYSILVRYKSLELIFKSHIRGMVSEWSYPNTDEWMKWPAQTHLPLSVLFSAAWMLFWDRISPVIWVSSWGPWFALPESYQAVITVSSWERIFKCCHSQAVGLHKLALSLVPLSDLVS